MDRYDEMAFDLVKAQASVKSMTPSEMSAMQAEIANTFRMKESGAVIIETAAAASAVLTSDPKTAITETYVRCCVCGQKMRMLTQKHLATHGLTPESYRELCGYKPKQSLVAKALRRERKKKMTEMKLWERRGKKNNIPAEKSKSGKPAAAKPAVNE